MTVEEFMEEFVENRGGDLDVKRASRVSDQTMEIECEDGGTFQIKLVWRRLPEDAD